MSQIKPISAAQPTRSFRSHDRCEMILLGEGSNHFGACCVLVYQNYNSPMEWLRSAAFCDYDDWFFRKRIAKCEWD